MLTAVADLLFVASLAGFFLAFGRSSSRSHHPPLRSLTASQFTFAVLHGIVAFARLHERRRTRTAGGYCEPVCRTRS